MKVGRREGRRHTWPKPAGVSGLEAALSMPNNLLVVITQGAPLLSPVSPWGGLPESLAWKHTLFSFPPTSPPPHRCQDQSGLLPLPTAALGQVSAVGAGTQPVATLQVRGSLLTAPSRTHNPSRPKGQEAWPKAPRTDEGLVWLIIF